MYLLYIHVVHCLSSVLEIAKFCFVLLEVHISVFVDVRTVHVYYLKLGVYKSLMYM